MRNSPIWKTDLPNDPCLPVELEVAYAEKYM